MQKQDWMDDTVNEHVNVGRGKFQRVPSIDKELKADNDYWEKEN